MADIIDADVAVVGAGPAGIAAACRAAESGARVIVLDEAPRSGGQIWRHGAGRKAPAAARAWLERLAASGATVLAGSAVVDAEGNRDGGPDASAPALREAAHAGFHLLAERADRPLRVRAGKVVLATGARELFLPFPGWTLPNVIGVGAAQALLKSGASFRGLRVVVAGSGPLLLPVAAALVGNGARLRVVAEQAPARVVGRFVRALLGEPAKLFAAAFYRAAFLPAAYRLGTWVTSARGDGRVEEVELTNGARVWTEPCDVLCCGFGLVPNLELPRRLGCDLEWGAVAVDRMQETNVPGLFCAGEPTGVGGVEPALVQGEIAGLAAAGRTVPARLQARQARGRAFAEALAFAFRPREELRLLAGPDTVICRCEDVRLGRLSGDWGPRRAKLYARAGMGPCQARVCGPALEFLFGWSGDTVRPPLKPATLETLGEER